MNKFVFDAAFLSKVLLIEYFYKNLKKNVTSVNTNCWWWWQGGGNK